MTESKPKSLKVKILLILAGVFLLFIVIVGWIGSSKFADLLTEKIISEALASGVKLKITKPSFIPFSSSYYRIENLSLSTYTLPTSLELTDIKFGISPIRSLFSDSLEGTLFSKIYGGDFSSKILLSKKTGEIGFNSELKDMVLNQNPFAALSGITKGTLSLKIRDGIISTTKPVEGNVSLKIMDLQKPGEFTLPLSLTKGLPIKIPPLTFKTLTCETKLSQNSFNILSLVVDSSLGTLKGGGTITPRGRTLIDPFKAEVHLTESGKEILGPWLPLLSEGRIDKETTNLRFTINHLLSPKGLDFDRID